VAASVCVMHSYKYARRCVRVSQLMCRDADRPNHCRVCVLLLEYECN